MKPNFRIFFLGILFFLTVTPLKAEPRQMEYLNRGLIAVKGSGGVLVSWRYLPDDDPNIAFNIYRNQVKITNIPITGKTNFSDASGESTSYYTIKEVINGIESTEAVQTAKTWSTGYQTIKLNRPRGGITPPNQYGSVGKAATETFPDGQPYGYSPNDCSVGDLDGDGEYEIIVKWDPSNSQDNSYYGITGNVYLDAYKLDGTQLWRIDLGKNIRAGAHYTQFLVYDFDGDGFSELICKTAPGTIDGNGKNVIMNNDDPHADYRSLDYSKTSGSTMLGTVLSGQEYLTLFDGKTGAELNTIAYKPERGSLSGWGDSYGNRSDRFLACVAYLDGVHPAAVMCRGYYARTTLVSYHVKDRKLVQNWIYDSATSTGLSAAGQGNHNLSVADVDKEGKDEIIYGSCAFDDDGTLLYSTGLGHGDAMHVSDMDPDRPGLEVWQVHEESAAFSKGYEMHDAANGEIIWSGAVTADNGRGMAGDIDAGHPGFEMWSTSGSGTYNNKGVQISTKKPSVNFRIYWDGDLQDELLDGTKIDKWNGNGTTTLLSASGVSSCNSTKKTPCLSADILGDWREELILWTTADSSHIRIYSTSTPTNHRLYSLMYDPVYRLGIAWQNAAYNQPPHLGSYIGGGVSNISKPDIYIVKANTALGLHAEKESKAVIYCKNSTLMINSNSNIHHVSIYSILGELLYACSNVGVREFSTTIPGNESMMIVSIKTDDGIQTVKIVKQ